MKFKFFLLLFLMPLTCLFSQELNITGKIIDNSNLPVPAVTIKLYFDGKVVQEGQSDFNGNFAFDNINANTYNLELHYVSWTKRVVNIDVHNDINMTIYFPCTPSDSQICPHKHSDNIIPIVYGMPSVKTTKRAEKGKIKLGGCVSSCEKWHCKTHNIDF
jgi:hypothetical protein